MDFWQNFNVKVAKCTREIWLCPEEVIYLEAFTHLCIDLNTFILFIKLYLVALFFNIV